MGNHTATSKQLITVEISPNRLSASIKAASSARPEQLTSAIVIEAVEGAGVAISESVVGAVDRFLAKLAKLEKGATLRNPFVIAEGVVPFDGLDEELEWDDVFQSESTAWLDDAPVDFYSLNSILTVEADVRIGTIRPIDPPRDGVDVLGKAIAHQGSPKPMELHATLRRGSDDPAEVFSQIAGKVTQKGRTLEIEETLMVPGDVGFDTGNIDACISVHINGRIPDRFEVKSNGSIVVGGSVEAANVFAGDDVIVCHGILGRGGGLVTAEGEIVAKFATEANLVAAGRMRIGRQLMNCHVCVSEDLYAPSASVIGGCLYTKGDVEVSNLGSDANIPTRIVVAVDPRGVREVALINGKIRRVESLAAEIRELIQPFLSDDKPLADEPRKLLNDLLSKVADSEAVISDDRKRREDLFAKIYAEKPASVFVSGTIHQGVTVRLGDREIIFHKDLKGPVTIEKRKIKNVTEIVSVNKLTGSISILKGERRSLDQLLDGFALEDDLPPSR